MSLVPKSELSLGLFQVLRPWKTVECESIDLRWLVGWHIQWVLGTGRVRDLTDRESRRLNQLGPGSRRRSYNQRFEEKEISFRPNLQCYPSSVRPCTAPTPTPSPRTIREVPKSRSPRHHGTPVTDPWQREYPVDCEINFIHIVKDLRQTPWDVVVMGPGDGGSGLFRHLRPQWLLAPDREVVKGGDHQNPLVVNRRKWEGTWESSPPVGDLDRCEGVKLDRSKSTYSESLVRFRCWEGLPSFPRSVVLLRPRETMAGLRVSWGLLIIVVSHDRTESRTGVGTGRIASWTDNEGTGSVHLRPG